MRSLRVLLLLAGAALLGLLLAGVGPARVLAALDRLAWWQFALLCLPHAVVLALDSLGWRYAFARDRVPFGTLLAARAAGEAVNVVTALGAMGGEPVKAWLVRRHAGWAESVPAVIVAKTTITAAQALFLVVGIGVAAVLGPRPPALLGAMLWLLLVEVVAVGGFVLGQVGGLVGRAGRLLAALGLGGGDRARRVEDDLRRFYRSQPRRLAWSVGFHLAGWLLGAVETFLILLALGVPASLPTALVIEALGSAVRFATFLVPASLGALEGANAAAFTALGLGADRGLAYSVVRRGRQAVWILVGLGLILVIERARTTGAPRRRAPRSAA